MAPSMTPAHPETPQRNHSWSFASAAAPRVWPKGTERSHLDRYELATFFSKIELCEDGCWLWRAARKPDNYGTFRGTSAHRVAYLWFVGAIPAGYQVDHLCRHPWCVNPAHLEAVSQHVNQQRASRWLLTGMCRRGHPMTPENIGQQKVRGAYIRVCLACRAIRDARRPKRSR